MKLFRKARELMASLIGAGTPAVADLPEGTPIESVQPVTDAIEPIKDYGYWRDYWANRKRRLGFSAKSPQWYGNAGYTRHWLALNKRLARAHGPGSYDEGKQQDAAKRAARKLACAP